MLNIKFLIIKLIHLLILLTFYVGIGLAFLFNDLSYLKISGIGFSYFILNKFNIPILSPIVRIFTWEIIKDVIFKSIKDNTMLISMILYLNTNKTPKNIYIQHGIKSLEIHLFERSELEMKQFEQSMQGYNKIQENFRKVKEQGISRDEIESIVIEDLKNIISPSINGITPETEKSKEIQKGLASLIIDFEELKMNLEELKAKGTPNEELKKMSQEGFIKIMSKLNEKINIENGSKQ